LSETFAQEYSLPLPIGEVKALGEGDPGGPAYEVEGYVATYSNRDLGGDVIAPGAFDATLAAGHKIRFLRQHDHGKVLGVVLGLKSDDHGLHGRFKISRTPLGEETYQLLRDGALDAFSIGYIAEDAEQKDGGVRELRQVALLETSVVSIGMNPRALVTAVKGGSAGAAGLPFDALWQQLRDAFVSLRAGVTEAKALSDRRREDGRELSERHRTALTRTLTEAEATLEGLRTLVTPTLAQAPSKEEPAPEAKAEADGLRLRLELARRRLQRAGVLERLA
jgi:HK97 family phage prohead protease